MSTYPKIIAAKDARIAELEAENERLREQITKATDPTYLEEKLRQIGVTDEMATEALSAAARVRAEAAAETLIDTVSEEVWNHDASQDNCNVIDKDDLTNTGEPVASGVRVKPLDLSNLLRHAFFEGFMIAGGSQEAAAEWWPEYDPETCAAYSRILSALEPAAPESEPRPMTGFFSNLSPEGQAAALAYDGPEPNIGDTAPEGQQEPVAWGEFYGGKIVAVSLHKSHHYTVPLYTHLPEQAVTEAWRPIETAPRNGTQFQAWIEKYGWEPRARFNPDSEAFELWGRVDYDKDGWDVYPHMVPTHWMPLPTAPALNKEDQSDA